MSGEESTNTPSLMSPTTLPPSTIASSFAGKEWGAPQGSTPAPSKNTRFFIENVTFLVENELFKVPRLYFEKNSSIFSDMFQVPSTDNREGNSEEFPIDLQSIRKFDFERLLMAMFPDVSRYIPKPIQMEAREWTSVLKLSTLWRFGELRREAIEELTKLECSPVDKITLGREYCVEAWLVSGYKELIERETSLTQKEKSKLGASNALKIYEAREETFRIGGGTFNGSRDLSSAESLVRREFEDEIDVASYDGGAFEEEFNAADALRPKTKQGEEAT